MTLTVASHLRVPGHAARTCEGCGSRLIPYIPACASCGAPVTSDARRGERGLAKPAGVTRIAHLSDLHVRPGSPAIGAFEAWLRELGSVEVDMLVVSGDLVDRGDDLESMKLVHRALLRSGLRWCVVPGNHDVEGPTRAHNFEALFGRYPRVEHHGGVDFVLVDSNAGLAEEERVWGERMFARYKCFTEGRVGSEQMAAVEALLTPGSRRVLVLHHHLAYQSADPLIGSSRVVDETVLGTMLPLHDADSVRGWAARNAVSVVLHGHKHVMMRAGVHLGGLLVLNGGSSTGLPYRARLLDLGPEGQRTAIEIEMRP